MKADNTKAGPLAVFGSPKSLPGKPGKVGRPSNICHPLEKLGKFEQGGLPAKWSDIVVVVSILLSLPFESV